VCAWAPGGWRECSLNFHSAPCIAVQRGAKFDGALPQLFIYLADRTRPMRIEFRVSVSDHCQRFGNCLGLAILSDLALSPVHLELSRCRRFIGGTRHHGLLRDRPALGESFHFGPMIAADLRKRRPKPHTTWHLDEVYLKISKEGFSPLGPRHGEAISWVSSPV
jgi:hypothetical protein